MKISKEAKAIVREYYEDNYKNVSPIREQLVDEVLNLSKESERLQLLKDEVPCNFEKIKILNVGCGFGSFNYYAFKEGIDCEGLEPEEPCHLFYKKVYPEQLTDRIKKGSGEKLPYPDEVFDLVVSFQVLEHVRSPEKTITEALRVLKKGGYLYFNFPNYASFWEPHYGIIWPLSFITKPLLRFFVKLKGRDPSFVDTLNLQLTPWTVKKMVTKHDVKILNLGESLWRKRMETMKCNSWGNTKVLLSIVALLNKLGLVKLIIFLNNLYPFYYPIVLVCKKSLLSKTGS